MTALIDRGEVSARMAMPLLYLKKKKLLGRAPVASDFSIEERKKLKKSLDSLIEFCKTKTGNTDKIEKLKSIWTDCVSVGSPPSGEITPEVARQARLHKEAKVIINEWRSKYGFRMITDAEAVFIKSMPSANDSDPSEDVLPITKSHPFDWLGLVNQGDE